ncbi:biopolymer transporter ExbD, partial [Bacteroides thetaiotaomicron]|nr:biopolymer transporter ExbD [Bacteroides thetaiotaomicron]
VDRQGEFFWNAAPVDASTLLARLKGVAVQSPQPDVHVRGDESTRYEFVGRVIAACERAGIEKVSFITEPPARGS